MSTLAAGMTFDFMFPSCEPSTPPSFGFDPRLLEIPRGGHHARSSSHSSSVSMYSQASSSSPSDSAATRMTTPSVRASPPPIRQHGPILLPKIRSQDQAIGGESASNNHYGGRAHSPPKRVRTARTSPPAASAFRPQHARSFTNPENNMVSYSFPPPTIPASASGLASLRSTPGPEDQTPTPTSLLCSPVTFAQDAMQQQHQQHHQHQHHHHQHARRASSVNLDSSAIEKYGFPTYRGMPAFMSAAGGVQANEAAFVFPAPAPTNPAAVSYTPRAPSPLSLSSHQHQHQHQHERASSSMSLPPNGLAHHFTPEPSLEPPPTTPTRTLLSYLTTPNPAPSLVRTLSFPLRDPHTRHFWWDVRQVRAWSDFTATSILALPGADALLNMPVPASLLPAGGAAARHPETEQALCAIYAAHYLPRLNAALAVSSTRPIQFAGPVAEVAGKPGSSSASLGADASCLFTATCASDPSASSVLLFGGKPSARVVGLVKSFDRFNSGMRAEGNVKRVEYLRGLAHLHHVMREHGTRYGFILTEIELVVVRNGEEGTPNFGFVEVKSIQLNAAAAAAARSDHDDEDNDDDEDCARSGNSRDVPLTACLALWGLCMLASDDVALLASSSAAQFAARGLTPPPMMTTLLPPQWRAEIGAPAEGTRRKALGRDNWMPQPQLAEKREAKRSRGWVWPEDPVGRKELGKRGVKYGGC